MPGGSFRVLMLDRAPLAPVRLGRGRGGMPSVNTGFRLLREPKTAIYQVLSTPNRP